MSLAHDHGIWIAGRAIEVYDPARDRLRALCDAQALFDTDIAGVRPGLHLDVRLRVTRPLRIPPLAVSGAMTILEPAFGVEATGGQ